MNTDDLLLFAPSESQEFAEGMARLLGIGLGNLRERNFEDGEHKLRPLVNVRNRDVYVVQSLYGDHRLSVNDKLCRLLFLLATLRDASAARVTAIVPYLAYTRKDRKTRPRDPVTTRYVAQLIESVGTDRIVTLDVHNLSAYQNAFGRTTTEHLEALPLFVEHLASGMTRDGVAVASPDVGGIKRSEALREALQRALGQEVTSAFMEKKRSGGVVSGDAVVGDVTDKTVVLVDDLISTGTTLCRAADALRQRGASRVVAAVTHGVFSGDAAQKLADSRLDELVTTNTIPPFRLPPELVEERITVLDVAPLFGEAVKRLHSGGSLVQLLEI